MTTISNFISRVKNDNFARENRFEVIITPPPALQASSVENSKVQFYCQAVSMPGVNFLSQPVYSFGESREVIYNRSFDPIQLEFLVDEKMQLRWFFDRWAELIVNPRTRVMNYYKDYISTIDIAQLSHDKNEETKYVVRLHEAFPKTFDPVQYTANSKDFVKMRMSIQYKYWTVVDSPAVNSQTSRDKPNKSSIQSPL